MGESPERKEIVTYQPKPEDWATVRALADRILSGGTVRDNGLVDRDWDNDLMQINCILTQGRDVTGIRYALSVWNSFSDPSKGSMIEFNDKGVDRLQGEMIQRIEHLPPNEKRETAEIALRLYLQTAPEAHGY